MSVVKSNTEKRPQSDQQALPDTLAIQTTRNVPETLGERAVSWAAEGGLNWLLNSVMSLYLTKMYNERLVPKKFMQDFFNNWAEKSAGKPLSSSETDLHDHAIKTFAKKRVNMDIFETAFMCIAGTVIMFPYKALKENAQKIAYRFDRKFEKWGWQKEGTAEAKAQARGESMDNPHEEKLSWSDLLVARVTGIAVAIFAGTVLEKHATGSWFSKFHPEGADKGEQLIKWNENKTEVIGIEDVIHSRGQNFKSLSLRAGRSLSSSLEGTNFGKKFGITSSSDANFSNPTKSEDFTRLVIKELTLTGVLAAVMPITLNIINFLRGKPKQPQINTTGETASKQVPTSAHEAEVAEKKEEAATIKHTDRTERKPITDITPRKDQPAEAMTMGVM